MKKIIKISFIILIGFFCNIYFARASTNTNVRTEDNYLVESWVEVTEANKNNILTTPSVLEEEKIYDFADLYTESEEKALYEKIDAFISSYHMDLVVVTINTNNKSSPRVYADDFYDYNKFGVGDDCDGVLFLIDMENREIYMSTTGSAIMMYNDYRINEALDEVYQYMSDQDYYLGTSNYIEIIGNYAEEGPPSSKKMSTFSIVMWSLVVGIVVTIIVMLVLIKKNKLVRKATTAEEYLDKESVDIKNIGDILISTNTMKTKIEHDTSSGSSTHSGSSGSSHGGGGHGF